jgi:serine protease inhibitor
MKKLLIFIMATTLCWSCESQGGDDPVFEYNKKSAEVINTNNSFGLELFRRVIEHESGPNVMISPASVSLAMGMAYNGSETSTKVAFDSVLNYEGVTREEVNEITLDLINTLVTNNKDVLLEIANSIWYRSGFPVYDSFLQMNSTYFNAEVAELDFSSTDAIATINDWVADKTHDKILKIIDELSPESMMVLINALYFNCMWETEFDPDETKEEMFYNEDGTALNKVEMMTTEAGFSYSATEDYTAVELPYKDHKFSMYLFLPAPGNTVKTLTDKLDGETWSSWLADFSEHDEVQVTLPKFKFDYMRSLSDDLSAMGLEVAFSDRADFSGISEIPLFISDVIHKTYIDVNEEGTEAAAVTAIVFNVTSVGPSGGPIIIRFDRPFLFAITENSSNAVVFIGTVAEPEYE